MSMDKDLNSSLPTSLGIFNVRSGPRETWAGKFPIKFSALNAAVRWHLMQFQLQDLKYSVVEETTGFIQYATSLLEVDDLGKICIRELSDEHSTALIITPPSLPKQGWTLEQQQLIDSQPDRESELKLRYELAVENENVRRERTKLHEFVFNLFLRDTW